MEFQPKQIIKDAITISRNLGLTALELIKLKPHEELLLLSNEQIDELLHEDPSENL